MPKISLFKTAVIEACNICHSNAACSLLELCLLLDKHVYTHTCIVQLRLTVYSASGYNSWCTQKNISLHHLLASPSADMPKRRITLYTSTAAPTGMDAKKNKTTKWTGKGRHTCIQNAGGRHRDHDKNMHGKSLKRQNAPNDRAQLQT